MSFPLEVVVIPASNPLLNSLLIARAQRAFPNARVALVYRGEKPITDDKEVEVVSTGEFTVLSDASYKLIAHEVLEDRVLVEYTRLLIVLLRDNPVSVEVFRLTNSGSESIALAHR